MHLSRTMLTPCSEHKKDTKENLGKTIVKQKMVSKRIGPDGNVTTMQSVPRQLGLCTPEHLPGQL
jgi:hypothetical protein